MKRASVTSTFAGSIRSKMEPASRASRASQASRCKHGNICLKKGNWFMMSGLLLRVPFQR